MYDVTVIWDDEPGGNLEHIEPTGLSIEEVEEVMLDDTLDVAFSDSTGNPCRFGYTSTGRYIIVVWTEVNEDPRMIYPVTAYDVPEPR